MIAKILASVLIFFYRKFYTSLDKRLNNETSESLIDDNTRTSFSGMAERSQAKSIFNINSFSNVTLDQPSQLNFNNINYQEIQIKDEMEPKQNKPFSFDESYDFIENTYTDKFETPKKKSNHET